MSVSTQHGSPEKKKAEEPIVWTYNKVLLLMQIIRAWIERDVPASQMGIFFVEVLYQTDKHMNSRVTKLVDTNETYEKIAKTVVEFFQIRDEWLQPLWTELNPGDPDLRPGIEYSPEPMTENSVTSDLVHEYEGSLLFAPKPVRCVHWPFFPSKEELQTTLNRKNSEEDSEEDDLNQVDDHTDGDIPCYGAVKKNTTTLSHTGPLPISSDLEATRLVLT
ncbi:hypothetical protein VI817_009661 [Penicillium citrinum]|nr:hypothetical protein VI817_009661 [Penicillium citrinum]